MQSPRDRAKPDAPRIDDRSAPTVAAGEMTAQGRVAALQERAGNRAVLAALRQPGVLTPDVQRLVVRRDIVDDWDSAYKGMSADGKTGYDQFLALNGPTAAERASSGAKLKDKDNAGKFDTARADAMWSKKKMDDTKFADAMKAKREKDTKDVKDVLGKMNHICNETDGTNRPGSVGDGTSDWALYWEAEHGEPFRSPAGHAYKLRDYCKVLSEGLAEIASKKASVPPDDKMEWRAKQTDPPVQVETATQISAVVVRSTERLTKMRAAVKAWNARITSYPDKWNADGTSKLAPPGLDPLAKGQLAAGWPKDKEVKEY